jgi:L-ribulose-5-phosphate 3-epimerase UlaE
MLVGQLNVSPGIGNIFSHGNDRSNADIGSSIKHLTAIRVKRRITDVGVGVYNLRHTQHNKAHGLRRRAQGK